MESDYELIIIGAGPAGLTAGLYAARSRLRVLLIERETFGGEIINSELVENYPGFPDGISGVQLGMSIYQQATKQGLKIMMAEATGMELDGKNKVIKTSSGNCQAPAVIIAAGAGPLKLGVPGEAELTGSGVFYCAMCDAPGFQDQVTAVAGGGDAGITEGLYLARFASKVTVIEMMPQLNATKVLQERARAEPKMEFLTGTVIEAIEGADKVTGLKLRNVSTGEKSTLEVSGLLVHIGLKPSTDYLKGVLPLDDQGFIIVNDRMETEVPGVFAAGDIRHNSARQVITAAGDGATAALSAEKFLSGS